jgi:hypothetical protein
VVSLLRKTDPVQPDEVLVKANPNDARWCAADKQETT